MNACITLSERKTSTLLMDSSFKSLASVPSKLERSTEVAVLLSAVDERPTNCSDSRTVGIRGRCGATRCEGTAGLLSTSVFIPESN